MKVLELTQGENNELKIFYTRFIKEHNNHIIESGIFLVPEPSSDVVWVTHCVTCNRIVAKALISRKFLNLKGE